MASKMLDEKAIFNVARQIGSPDARAEYLQQACGTDSSLRERVQVLLRAYEEQASFLESPPPVGGIPTIDQPASESPGAVIGPYKLIEQIGEGGMGTVWMAQQQEPVKRLVALKLIKAGMDSKQVIARFEAERQALALMDHPHIAKVHDAGTSPDGRPYFVMELVKGVPITKYCDEYRLMPRQRLELFIPVCQAVQHAHQKGIIHRDLKPSNVLVAPYDGRPIVKVIDFGVAKATGQQLTDRTLVTGFGAVVGTLEYMSPEQAELNNHDIDTRSDVYALGVLLYELLTGSPPFSRQESEMVGMLEMLRVIREQEPTKPSTKLSTAEGLPTLAANRGTEPAKLTRLVRGELDWIVMKALEKDRSRRYDTATAFAQDVQRYLHDEPVQAGPPSAAYRLRKFVKRQRGPVLAGTLVLLVLVSGILGTTFGLVEAELARQGAVMNEKKAQEEEARAKADRDRAEWLLYASQINLAQQYWDSNNAVLAFHHLDSCRPDFRSWEHDYLFTLFCSNQRTFGNPPAAGVSMQRVSSVALSADGKRIVSGYHDRTIRVWDTATGQQTLAFRKHFGSVTSVAWDPDGHHFVSGGLDNTVRVWDAATGQQTLSCEGHTDAVTSVAVSPDGRRIVSGSRDNTVKVWDAATGEAALTLKGHTDQVTSVAVSPDGRRIVSGSRDNTMKVWDATTGKKTRTLRGHTDAVSSVAFSPDGKRLVSGSHDNTVKVWDAETGEPTRSLKGGGGPVTSVAFSPDGKRIISGNALDYTVRVWDATTGEETLTLKGHKALVSSVAVMPDGRGIVSGSHDNTVKVWDVARGPESGVLKGHTGLVSSVAVMPDGRRIVSGSHDSTVKVWDPENTDKPRSFFGLPIPVISVAVSPDSRRIVSGSRDWTVVIVWDTVTSPDTRLLQGHTGFITSVAWSPNGKRIVSGSHDSTVKVWDVATGRELLTSKEHTASVTSVAWSPDGQRIVSSSADRTVKVWDADTGAVAVTLKLPTYEVTSVAFSPDGQRLVSGSSDRTVRVWDTTTGCETLALKGHAALVSSVAFSPDGRRIISGSHDQTVKVWDAATGYETMTLKGHGGPVNSVALSRDGKRLVSGSTDQTVRVWDASMSQQKP